MGDCCGKAGLRRLLDHEGEGNVPMVAPASGVLAISLVAIAPVCFVGGATLLALRDPTIWSIVGAGACAVAAAASSLAAYLVISSRASVRHVEPWSEAGDLSSAFAWDGKRKLRVLFMTWGSRGDHEPNVALGLELARRGHEVTVMAYERHREMVERHAPALRFREILDENMPAAAKALNEPGADFLGIAGAFARDNLRALAEQYVSAAEEADVLVGQCVPLCTLVHFTAAQIARKPLFLVSHDPINGHNSAAWSYSPGTNRCADHGYLANVLNSRALGVVVGLTAAGSPVSVARAYRHERGLSTPWPLFEVLHPKVIASIPVICTFDRTLWPRPTDFSDHWYLTGWFDKGYDAVEADPRGVKRYADPPHPTAEPWSMSSPATCLSGAQLGGVPGARRPPDCLRGPRFLQPS